MKNLVLSFALTCIGISAFAHTAESGSGEYIGTEILTQEFSEINVSDLPEAVTKAVAKDYSGATIDKAYVNGSSQYKLEISMEDGTALTLYADANGNWIEL